TKTAPNESWPLVFERPTFDLNPLFCWCREGGSNPHDRKGRRILSPLRLPVPPSRHEMGGRSKYRIAPGPMPAPSSPRLCTDVNRRDHVPRSIANINEEVSSRSMKE